MIFLAKNAEDKLTSFAENPNQQLFNKNLSTLLQLLQAGKNSRWFLAFLLRVGT